MPQEIRNLYRETEPETGLIDLVFRPVRHYEGLTGALDSFIILNVGCREKRVAIVLLDDFNDVCHELSFDTKDICIEPC